MSDDSSIIIRQRECNPELFSQTTQLHPVLQRVLSARAINDFNEVDYSLDALLKPERIAHLEEAATLLARHVQAGSRIVVFGDYDADGATSTALCIRALRSLGHDNAGFILPDRFTDGYGVSETAAERLCQLEPDLVITVDTGIASFTGVRKLKQAGIDVIITDHHLPASSLPDADVIVNPNAFEDSGGKALAGVGVAFYLMLALRARLRELGWFDSRAQANLAECLDLVAIGTIADLVPLDYNNRILVYEGLKRIRAGACSAGINALLEISGRSRTNLSSQDIAFALAPRINAAGRLDDMSIGVQTLLSNESTSALALANELETINNYRRELQSEMTLQALSLLDKSNSPDASDGQRFSQVLFHPQWHEGIVGIIASRIKDEFYRPVIAFARSGNGLLKGSGRSIAGIHLRDMLDLVDKMEPGLMLRFGGHAMAAGLTLKEANLEKFREVFEQVLLQKADAASFDNIVLYDGQIPSRDLSLHLAEKLQQAGPWGQHFPVPSFIGEFRVLDQRILSDRHLKFVIKAADSTTHIDAILFYASEQQQKTHYQFINLHYELTVNHFRGERNLQLLIRHIL
jgi:single-stranded-DNA-specific exonuclease